MSLPAEPHAERLHQCPKCGTVLQPPRPRVADCPSCGVWLALPLAIGAAFLWRQGDPFGAAVCLWWTGASLVDLSPYIWDALQPQLTLLGGHTGESGGHDWIYLLERLGALRQAHGWGTAAHHLGTLVMGVALVWGVRARLQHHSAERTPD